MTAISDSLFSQNKLIEMTNLSTSTKPKFAIVHDYFGQYGGAEKVVETWLEMFPEAVLYTSYFIPEKFASSKTLTEVWNEDRVITTPVQHLFKIKFFQKFQKHLFWLYPILMSFLKVKNADVVLISSTYCGKNVKIENHPYRPNELKSIDSTQNIPQTPKIIHYCHSPTRFLHGLVTETDHKSLPVFLQALVPLFTFWLKWLDLASVKYLNSKGTLWVGNSKFICGLIKEVYGVDSKLIYPPVEINNFLEIQNFPTNFYLCHGRISFHKRLDLAVEACLELGRHLVIGGTSALPKEVNDLKNIVLNYELKHPEAIGLIKFLGRTTDDQYVDLLSKTKGFLFPGKEDAGITPIEVFASGVPVIAYKAGGALEYLQDSVNGVFFEEQTVESLKKAILRYENTKFNSKNIKKTAQPFGREVFEREILELI